ncbi:MAG: hypothetical protein Q8P95_00150 [bacterium]|nr:hypothetical protein [bacterium]
MAVDQVVSLILLGILIGAQFTLRSYLRRWSRLFVFFSIAAIALLLLYQMHDLFISWIESDPPARYIAPPFRSVSYFFFIAYRRLIAPYFISLVAAGVAFILIRLLPKERRERLFLKEEPSVLFLAIFLSPHPFWLLFLAASLLLYMLYSLATRLIRPSSGKRISFYYFWPMVAFALITLSPFLLRFEFIRQLRFAA